MKLFIESGSDINSENRLKNTALHLAAMGGCKNMVKFLIDNGANVNAKNSDLDIPLNVAAKNGNFDICPTLFE